MAILFDYMIKTLQLLGVRTSVAVSGSTTTIVDAVNRVEADSHFNGGTAWILSAGAVAPENEYRLVTSYIKSTGTLTTKAFSAAVDAGDTYAVSEAFYPPDLLIDALNLAFGHLRYIYHDDNLVVVAGQTEYTLPAQVKRGRIREISVQTNSDSDDNRYQKIGGYDTYVKYDEGLGDQEYLVIPQGLVAGRKLLIEYELTHEDFGDFVATSRVYKVMEPKYVIYRAAEYMLLRQMGDGDEWPYLEERLNYFMDKAAAFEAEYNSEAKQMGRAE